MNFSPERLKAMRGARGFARATLAARIGVSVHSLLDYETGITAPNARVLARLADELKCPVGEFFGDEHDRWASELVAALPPMSPHQIAAAARAFAAIDTAT
ncbi:helix-turn-helix domain-containing protein [Streptomyces sp. NPDC057686]|uniref:helix-turn-helix domain-containing protein n=1 Tax=Streptomyces sp. NPDC057686 TaxID=3346212 RepID=UPI0036798BA6